MHHFLCIQHSDFLFSLVAEAVKVSVELKNPLHIPVDVSGISLICQLSTNLDALTSGIRFSFLRPFFPSDVHIRGIVLIVDA